MQHINRFLIAANQKLRCFFIVWRYAQFRFSTLKFEHLVLLSTKRYFRNNFDQIRQHKIFWKYAFIWWKFARIDVEFLSKQMAKESTHCIYVKIFTHNLNGVHSVCIKWMFGLNYFNHIVMMTSEQYTRVLYFISDDPGFYILAFSLHRWFRRLHFLHRKLNKKTGTLKMKKLHEYIYIFWNNKSKGATETVKCRGSCRQIKLTNYYWIKTELKYSIANLI